MTDLGLSYRLKFRMFIEPQIAQIKQMRSVLYVMYPVGESV